jgi:hypothetical protein
VAESGVVTKGCAEAEIAVAPDAGVEQGERADENAGEGEGEREFANGTQAAEQALIERAEGSDDEREQRKEPECPAGGGEVKVGLRGIERTGAEQGAADAPAGGGGESEREQLAEAEFAEDNFGGEEDAGDGRGVGRGDPGGDTAGDGERGCGENLGETPAAGALLQPRGDGGGELDHGALAADGGAAGDGKRGRGGAPEVGDERDATVLVTNGFDVLDEGAGLAAEAMGVAAAQREDKSREECADDGREQTTPRRESSGRIRGRAAVVRETPLQAAKTKPNERRGKAAGGAEEDGGGGFGEDVAC